MYNVFRKTVKSGEKSVKRWYYYYFDHGRQIQHICTGCKNQAEATNFVSRLPEYADTGTIQSITEYMYIPGSEHLKRLEQYGKKISKKTISEKRRNIKKICELWGMIQLSQLTPCEVGTYLCSVKQSGSYKNHFISTLKSIYEEAQWQGIKIPCPQFTRFALNYKKADVLYLNEVQRLFKPENFVTYDVYLLFQISLSAGLRIGEARALRPSQFNRAGSAVIVDGFCKNNGERTTYNKSGTDENPKLRVAILPDVVMSMIQEYIKSNNIAENDFVFKYNNRPMREEYLRKHFRDAIQKAKIISNGRKIVPHSLRYTYITRMRQFLSGEVVQKTAGHSCITMTDAYTRAVLPESIKALQGTRSIVNALFS